MNTEKKLSDIESEMEKLEIKINEIENKSIEKNLSYHDYEIVVKPFRDRYNKLDMDFRVLTKPEMEPIPKYGRHMKLNMFISNVMSGGFIDYDGSGRYATETEISDIQIYPSDIRNGIYRKDFKYIVWFNK